MVSPSPAEKLAVAEKHMVNLPSLLALRSSKSEVGFFVNPIATSLAVILVAGQDTDQGCGT